MNWNSLLSQELDLPYMQELKSFLARESGPVYPPTPRIFQALKETPFEAVKVVIVGQDPYHGEGQAEGLCFSVPEHIPIPPSLQNIFKELESDLGIPKPENGSLLRWAKQGVLLLNATLTVRKDSPKSHYGKGWEKFTDKIIACLLEKQEPIVFLLWGKSAIDKVPKNSSHHLFLTAPHPSPLSAYGGFFGCKHFSKANAFLQEHNRGTIAW